jgi:hypothetical protein
LSTDKGDALIRQQALVECAPKVRQLNKEHFFEEEKCP